MAMLVLLDFVFSFVSVVMVVKVYRLMKKQSAREVVYSSERRRREPDISEMSIDELISKVTKEVEKG